MAQNILTTVTSLSLPPALQGVEEGVTAPTPATAGLPLDTATPATFAPDTTKTLPTESGPTTTSTGAHFTTQGVDRVPSRSIDISSSSSSSGTSSPSASRHLPGTIPVSSTPMAAVHTPTVPQQPSKMQELLQERAVAPGYVPDAAAARTAAPDAPLEPLGSPVMMGGAASDAPLTPQPTPQGLTPSPLMGSLNPSAAPGADQSTFEASSIDAVAAEAAADAVEQRQHLMRDSPPSSAYHTPASGMSVASSRTGSVTGATTAGRGSIDAPSSMTAARGQFPAGGAAAVPSAGGVAETAGGEGLHVHVGQGVFVTEGLPARTDFDGALVAANKLADAVEAELPPKAFDELARPAGLVEGQPVSPHAHLLPDSSSSTAFGMTPRDIPHPTSGTSAVISPTGLQHDAVPSTCCGLRVCVKLQLTQSACLWTITWSTSMQLIDDFVMMNVALCQRLSATF